MMLSGEKWLKEDEDEEDKEEPTEEQVALSPRFCQEGQAIPKVAAVAAVAAAA